MSKLLTTYSTTKGILGPWYYQGYYIRSVLTTTTTTHFTTWGSRTETSPNSAVLEIFRLMTSAEETGC